MVEGGGLESRFTGNRNQGSNPCLSAILFRCPGTPGRIPQGPPAGSQLGPPEALQRKAEAGQTVHTAATATHPKIEAKPAKPTPASLPRRGPPHSSPA